MSGAGQGRAGSLFEALAESAPDVIVTIDATGRIQFVNRAVEQVLGFA